tara:strand:- start:147 stop:407 length:261 start_codon:yes stop_codon:yes gene_type:complete
MFTVSRPRLVIKCSNDKKKPKYTKYKDIKKTSEKEIKYSESWWDNFNMKGFLTKIFAPDGEIDYEDFNKNSKYAIRIEEKDKKEDK